MPPKDPITRARFALQIAFFACKSQNKHEWLPLHSHLTVGCHEIWRRISRILCIVEDKFDVKQSSRVPTAARAHHVPHSMLCANCSSAICSFDERWTLSIFHLVRFFANSQCNISNYIRYITHCSSWVVCWTDDGIGRFNSASASAIVMYH